MWFSAPGLPGEGTRNEQWTKSCTAKSRHGRFVKTTARRDHEWVPWGVAITHSAVRKVEARPPRFAPASRSSHQPVAGA